MAQLNAIKIFTTICVCARSDDEENCLWFRSFFSIVDKMY